MELLRQIFCTHRVKILLVEKNAQFLGSSKVSLWCCTDCGKLETKIKGTK